MSRSAYSSSIHYADSNPCQPPSPRSVHLAVPSPKLLNLTADYWSRILSCWCGFRWRRCLFCTWSSRWASSRSRPFARLRIAYSLFRGWRPATSRYSLVHSRMPSDSRWKQEGPFRCGARSFYSASLSLLTHFYAYSTLFDSSCYRPSRSSSLTCPDTDQFEP